MGHDISALKPNIDIDAIRDLYDIDNYNDEWGKRYDQYKQEIEVAYNRRSAGNPLNQVLYLALGVMDEAYAGCSGNGEELDITLEQFRNGLKILEFKSFTGMSRDRNMGDDLIDMFVAVDCRIDDGDISQEKEFINRCIEYLEKENLKSLTVIFG